jgi:hypothetical protein
MDSKTPMQGVIDRHGCPPDEFRAVTGGWCIPMYWSDVQPTPEESYNWQPIHDALAMVGPDDRCRIRLYAGIHSPRWVMDRAGCFAMPTISANCPAWWRGTFLDDYERLMHALAAEIEPLDQIAEIVMSGPCTEFCEPFIRQREDDVSMAQRRQLGFTTELDRQSFSACIQIHSEAFRRTYTGLASNPYQNCDLPKGQTDVSFTLDVNEEFRTVLGGLAVTGNDSIRWPVQSGDDYAAMHSWIKNAGPPIAYQTATWEKVGDLLATIDWSVEQGCNATEPPTQYKKQIPPADLAPRNEALRANPLNVAGI